MGKHILLIEDEPNIAEALRFILMRAGLKVSCHAQGADALETIRRIAPDAVILDAMLPGRSGFEVLQDLRAEASIQNIPVLFLTARGQETDRAKAAGADHFMTKPFSNAEVLATVQNLLGQR